MTNLDNSSQQSSPKFNKVIYSFVAVALIGFLDAVYLTTSHYTGHITCSVITGCQEVLVSQYSTILGIPVALLGTLYYLFILLNSFIYIDSKKTLTIKALSYIPTIGFLFSFYLLYLMFFVIEALCQYCLLSAGISTILFILSLILINKNKNYGQRN
ncbi:vitamin K epoxide reductase family protein [bacterium]|nr:vitamin K epoxide reductase family protein [bacterium]